MWLHGHTSQGGEQRLPRIFGAAYRFDLDTVAVNRGLKEQRGRTLVARHLEEPGSQMPLAVIGWHLPQRIADPLLVIAASPRRYSPGSPTLLCGPGTCSALPANHAPTSCSTPAIKRCSTPERSATLITSSATCATSAPYCTARSSTATGSIFHAGGRHCCAR